MKRVPLYKTERVFDFPVISCYSIFNGNVYKGVFLEFNRPVLKLKFPFRVCTSKRFTPCICFANATFVQQDAPLLLKPSSEIFEVIGQV